jgi:hypothetical protein
VPAQHGCVHTSPPPQEIRHPVSNRPTVHDWRGDYVSEAVSTGHPLVLELLFSSGYTVTWQNAQVRPASSLLPGSRQP